jgi:hypothetical protein
MRTCVRVGCRELPGASPAASPAAMPAAAARHRAAVRVRAVGRRRERWCGSSGGAAGRSPPPGGGRARGRRSRRALGCRSRRRADRAAPGDGSPGRRVRATGPGRPHARRRLGRRRGVDRLVAAPSRRDARGGREGRDRVRRGVRAPRRDRPGLARGRDLVRRSHGHLGGARRPRGRDRHDGTPCVHRPAGRRRPAHRGAAPGRGPGAHLGGRACSSPRRGPPSRPGLRRRRLDHAHRGTASAARTGSSPARCTAGT